MHKTILYFAVGLYGIPSGQYTSDIVAQAANVATAVAQIVTTHTAKANTCALLILGAANIAGTKHERTTIAETAFDVRFVSTLAAASPIKTANAAGNFVTIGVII